MSTTNSFPINKSESKSNSVIHHAEFSCFFLRRNHALSNFKIGHTLLQTTNQDDKYLLELICNNTETTLDEVILVISLSPLFFKTHQLSLSGMVSLKERNLSYREIMYLKVLFAHVEKDSYLQQVSAFYQFISAVHEEQQLISLKKQNGKFNNSQIIEYIERLIDLHLLDNKLPTIDNMAKELGISTSKFKLVTAQYYNQGIYQL